jgi:GT2 family glycosyltransferase
VIPAAIFPAYNRHDYLLRALQSIDGTVERGLIVDNGQNLAEKGDSYWINQERHRLNLEIFTPPYASMGYGGSINFGIMQMSDAPWWLWVSNDVVFHPGTIESVARRMNEVRTPRVITGGFTWGAINRQAVELAGLIDEWTFHPIYFDDNDYAYRCKLAGVEWIEMSLEGIEHINMGSATIKAEPKAQAGNENSFRVNADLYRRKWGGPPGQEEFTHPWNNVSWPIWMTGKPTPEGRRDRQW